VKLTWTMPSPVLSPYGRMISPTRVTPFQDLGGGVVVVILVPGDAVEALTAGGGTLHDPEGAVADRVQQRLGRDALEQVHGLGEDLVRALLDEPTRCRYEVLVQPAGRAEHVLHVLQGDVPIGQPGSDDRLGHHAHEQDALA